jgi:farnesyl diphosphate synthase
MLSLVGEDIGLLFQLADDFLDITGNKKLAGKPLKKDNKKGKSTLINLLGYDKAYNYANILKKNIFTKLKKYGNKAEDLTSTIEFILGRNF